MKTIQQWLAECDKEKLIAEYIYMYCNDLCDIPLKYRTSSINKLLDRAKKNVADSIEYLLSLEIIETKETKIIFGHNRYDERMWAELIHVEELLREGEECKTYAYEFSPAGKMVGSYLAENEYTRKNQYGIIAAFLHEVTFFGWRQEHLQKALEEMDMVIKETRSVNVKAIDFDDMLAEISNKYGIEDNYQEGEEEEKKRNQIEMEIYAFDNMCKKNALAEIIKLLQESGEC